MTRRPRGWAAVLIVALACAREPEPQTYEDCVITRVKSGMNEAAVALLHSACRTKFPLPATTSVTRELTRDEIALLDGRGGASALLSSFSGELYNGNTTIEVVKVRFSLTTTIGGKKATRLYEESMSLGPRTTESFEFGIIAGDQGAKLTWSIDGAVGVPVR